MRVIVNPQASDLQALAKRLTGKKSASAAMLDRLKALNPHVNFERIAAGTVLLLPDAPDLPADDKAVRSIGGEAFQDFVRHVEEGFKAAAERVGKAANNLAADRAAVAAALKIDIVKRQVERDPLLKKQLEDANAEANAEHGRIQEAARHMEAMHRALDEELKALDRLLR